MKKLGREDWLELIKELVGQKLDWDLSGSKLVGYRISPGNRLQVALHDFGPRDLEDTRKYMERVTEISADAGIDVIVLHKQPLLPF